MPRLAGAVPGLRRRRPHRRLPERDATYAWDVGAGGLMIAEAGGRIEDLDGGPLNLGPGVANVLATNGRIHDALAELARPVRASRRAARRPPHGPSRYQVPCATSGRCNRRHALGDAVAEIVPVDQFLEWYPGWTPELTDEPWVAERPAPFTKADEARFWFADFHWPRGFSPIGFLYVTDCSTWGTQTAAHWLPLPPGKGLVQRLGGPFLYESEVPDHLGVGARLPRRSHRAQHAHVPPELRRHLGRAEVGAGARPRTTSRATTSPASPWPTSGSSSPTPARSTAGPGRSTSS